MGEKFCLKWNNFQTHVSKSFGLLKNEEYLHDVTLVCDDNSQISAHKLVLSACSEYFKILFRNNRNQNPLICLEGTTFKELKSILDYMYNGEANIFQESLDSFLTLAKRLKVSGLLKIDKTDLHTTGETESENIEDEDIDGLPYKTKEEYMEEWENIEEENTEEKLYIEEEGYIEEEVYVEEEEFIEESLQDEADNSPAVQAIQTVSLLNWDQEEMDREDDENLETYSDGTLKCSFCEKVYEFLTLHVPQNLLKMHSRHPCWVDPSKQKRHIKQEPF